MTRVGRLRNVARSTDRASESAAEASLPGARKKPGRPKGSKASEAQKAAGKANLKKAQESKRAAAERRALEREDPDYKPRWKQLEDGDIDVSDLTSKELLYRACANNDGTWDGKRHALPARIIGRMEAESVKRARRGIEKLTGLAIKGIRARLEDDEAPAQQLAAAKMVLEYKIGKVPEVVHIGAETAYDRLQQSAFIIQRGGDLSTELEGMAEGAMDNTGHDVVPGQLEEKQDG